MIGRGPRVCAPGSGAKPSGRAADAANARAHSATSERSGGAQSPANHAHDVRQHRVEAGQPVSAPDTAATPPRASR